MEAELTRAEKQHEKAKADAEKANETQPEQTDAGSELDAEAAALLAQLNADPSQARDGAFPPEAADLADHSENAPETPPRSGKGGAP